MLSRTARSLETTLMPYSRQCLPRPARFLSSASKRANAPAVASATAPHPDYPPFMTTQTKPAEHEELTSGSVNEMRGFLNRRVPYTMLPTPLPDDETSALNEYYFTDSPTQDMFAIMDACLRGYDVSRAKQLFDRLRKQKQGDSNLDVRVYNTFMETYVDMATNRDPRAKDYWLSEAVSLYRVLELGKEQVMPDVGSYAIMLLADLRFGPNSETPVGDLELPNPNELLSKFTERGINLASVVAHRVITSSDEAAKAIKRLSKAAVEINRRDMVHELGQVEKLGSQMIDVDEVPEAIPVMVPKVKDSKAVADGAEGAEATDAEPEMQVPFNLGSLRKHLAHLSFARQMLSDDATARQKLLEDSVYDVAAERLQRQAEVLGGLGIDNQALKGFDLQKWMWGWHQKLEARLETEIQAVINAESRQSDQRELRLGPFLTLLKPEKLSLITILEIMRLQGSGGVNDGMKTARALLAVGKAVENEYKAEMCRKNKIQVPQMTKPQAGFFSDLGYRDLYQRRMAARTYMDDAEEWTSPWSQLLRVRVGSFLVDLLMDVATVERRGVNKATGEEVAEEHPAFYHAYEYLYGHKLGVIKLNPVVAERIAKDGLRETLHPRHLPMLVPPKPWVSHDQGAYLHNKSSAMRFKDSQEQQSYLRRASDLGNLELVFAAMDVLGSTPWRINRDVFDVVLETWNSGVRAPKIPPATYDAPEPEKPANADDDVKAKSVHIQRQRAWQQNRSNNHSDRCSVNYKIEIARAFLHDTFYYPHNLDFRGRAYPIPPHLNPVGDDLSRGLLLFAEAKPLGEVGLRWLKIHLANLYGYDKGSFQDRVDFVHEHLDDIYDSAENSLEGRRWWQNADDPWQCLAACKQLRAALESPNPEAYECPLPVHQDGTCNGLQHYAALGGDEQGARQVNLDVTERPSDVYTFVADMVEAKIKEDLAKPNPPKHAVMLSGKIARKVVKQTVMTTVYGVTFVGAREQIEKQLKDKGELPEEECWLAASYVAKKVLECIGDLFRGARDIQTWLSLSARLIAKSIPPDRVAEANAPLERKARTRKATPSTRLKKEQMTSVVWTTPLGLPIVQPYRKHNRKQISTALQTVYISDPNSPSEVNSMKQASAFPPNFIHSLDATHMMLTALQCRTQGITFASVHDSYWTHASDVGEMSKIIRDTFIALHSSDVLKRLNDEFHERYKGYKVPLISLRQGNFLKKAGWTPKGMITTSEGEDIDAAKEVDALLDEESAEGKKAGKKGRQSAVEDAESALADKFMDLTDILPRLPEKGNFDVTTIRQSLYFFS